MPASIFDDLPMPPVAKTLGWTLRAIDADAGTIEVGFTAGEAFTNPTGAVQGGFERTPPRVMEVKASAISLGNPGRADIAVGQRVFHSKFGYGKVAEIEGNKLEIDFEHAGRKRVLDSFVDLA